MNAPEGVTEGATSLIITTLSVMTLRMGTHKTFTEYITILFKVKWLYVFYSKVVSAMTTLFNCKFVKKSFVNNQNGSSLEYLSL